MLTAWRKGIDINGSGRIEESEVVDAVKRLGLDLDGKKLYGMLICGPKGLGLSLQQFDPDSWTRWVTGDLQGLAIGRANKEFFEDADTAIDSKEVEEMQSQARHGGGVAQFRQQMKLAEKAALKDEYDKITKMKAGLHNVKGFKQALIKRCGSLYGAWREALDLDGNGRLTFGEFCQGLQRLGMFGEIRGLWKQLDVNGHGYISFKDLDADTDAALQEFREKLVEKYGNMLKAWMKGVDVKGTNCVNEAAFLKACETVGFSGDAKKLFRVLQPDASRKYLTLKDFDTPAYQALSRADFRMISEEKGEKKSLVNMSFDERQEAGFFYQIRKAWDAAHRDEFQKACRYNNKEFQIDTSEEFESLCRRKFGSMTAAWRQCLDTDNNGKLTFGEFCNALRRLGYVGNFKKLWSEYDKDKKGVILMSDLDAEADSLIRSFLALLSEKFGDLDRAWQEGFHKDPHDSIDISMLREAAVAMGWEGNVETLFKNLQPMPGRVLISIWDLDPNCSRKRQRGEVAHISPKDPTEVRLHKKKFGEKDSGPQETTLRQGIPLIQQMRAALRKTYGSTAAAWCGALDPSLTNQVSFGKFCMVMQECTFEGKVKLLWEELMDSVHARGCMDQHGASYVDLDPDCAKLLDNFREQMISKSGSIMHCWKEALAPGGGPLDEGDFCSACQEAGMSVKNPKKVFKLLLARIGQRSINGRDLRVLLVGVPPQDRAGVWGAKPQQQSQETQQQEAPEEPEQPQGAD
ncbi:unnamed protein product [Prorocentrum cordatum]|uniref:EF-hand domain-containing protein n=1 Tax=Prorocentrum cordatum TaxID=2364126 RepID=A0ABN9UNV9_9DINO|nr:unnamed protein product [Polarella glacialis]